MLELPMNSEMGRYPYYHKIYVECFIKIYRLLKLENNKKFNNNEK